MNIKSSPLVKGALEAKRPTRWWLAWLVGLVVVLTPIFTVVPWVASFAKEGSFLAEALEIVPFLLTLGMLALWVVLKEKRPFSSIGFRGPHQLPRLLIGLLGGVGTMAAIGFALVGVRVFEFGGSHPTTVGVAALLPALVLLVTVGIQATTEEAVFRGYLLQVTGSQIPAWPTVILVGVVFAALHPTPNPFALANTLLVSLFFSFVSLAQGSIWTAAGFHIGWNWAQGNLLGVPVSGIPRDVAILALGPSKGSAWWLSGGEFGIEGSALATLALAGLAIWSYFYYRRAESDRAGAAISSEVPSTTAS